MLDKDTVVLFPDAKKKAPDQLPMFSIVYGDI